ISRSKSARIRLSTHMSASANVCGRGWATCEDARGRGLLFGTFLSLPKLHLFLLEHCLFRKQGVTRLCVVAGAADLIRSPVATLLRDVGNFLRISVAKGTDCYP